MSIRIKFFLSLLALSFGPLLIGMLVGRTNIIDLRATLSSLTHDQQTAVSEETRIQLVDKQTALLDRNAARTAIEVLAAARLLERADRLARAGLPIPTDRPEMVFTHQDFDDPANPPPGLSAVPGQFRYDEDGGRSPVRVSLDAPVFVPPPGRTIDEYEEQIDLLWVLAEHFIAATMAPEGSYNVRSRFVALDRGRLHMSWPGRGGYPERYDATRRTWYQQASTSLDPQGVIWTQPTIDAPTGQVRVTCAAPAYRDTGELIGVVGTDVLLSDIVREISLPASFEGRSRAMIVRAEERPGGNPGVRIWADASYDEHSGENWRSAVQLDWFGNDHIDADGQRLDTKLNAAFAESDDGTVAGRYEGEQWIWTFRRITNSEGGFYVLIGLSQAAVEQAVGQIIGEVTHAVDEAALINMGIAGGVLVLVAFVGLVGSKSITKPIRELATTAQRISEGDLEATADVRSGDEIGTLAESFNGMVPKLKDRLRVLESLALASEVQQHLLPKAPPSIEGLEIAARSVYCDETGGDYHDFYTLDKYGAAPAAGPATRCGVVVGDVTGHGIASALLMTTARALLRIGVTESAGPADALTRVNRHLENDSKSGRFMTLFYLVIDTAARRCTWASAGHDAAIVYHSGEQRFSEFEGADIPLGIDGSWAFTERSADLPDGSVIVIGTDGIWEARNGDGDMFGKDRLRAVVAERSGEPAAAIADAVLGVLAEFRGGAHQADDITLMVIKTAERASDRQVS
ncbi:MAG: SpoIIE family protein phosphatase [Planctomycetota bacterium]